MKDIENVIEQYLLGNLSTEEKLKFEEMAKQNPDVQSELSMQKNIIEAIKQTRRVELKSKLAQVNPSSVSSLTQKIAIAAATITTATLIGIGIYSTSIENTVAENSTQSESVTKVEQNEVNKPLDDADLVINEQVTVPNTSTSDQNEGSSKGSKNANLIVKQNSGKNPVVKNSGANQSSGNTSGGFNPFQNEESDDPEQLGNNDFESGHNSANHSSKTIVATTSDRSYNFLGYKYDGKDIVSLGKYETGKNAPEFSRLDNKIYVKYNGKVYEVVASGKEEKLANHEVTDAQILKNFK
jgi:hypothetical protein